MGHAAENRVGQRLRILLVEDHLILRQGLRCLLETDPDMQVVGEADTVAEALRAIKVTDPNVVITDISLPDRSGIELISALAQHKSSVPVLVLTVLDNEDDLRAAMRAGASGVVLKQSAYSELVEGLRTVVAGKKFLCATLSQDLLGELSQRKVRSEPLATQQPITQRERDILTRIARGQSNKFVARELGLSVKTIEKHRSNLMKKLNLHNAAAVTMFALRHGFVHCDDSILD
jgi:DNA-binding NarL/FixJ family response regulator